MTTILGGNSSFSNVEVADIEGLQELIDAGGGTANALDTETAIPLPIGETNATRVDIARAGIPTNIKGNLNVLGNLGVTGTITSVTELQVQDPIIEIAQGNVSDNVNTGLVVEHGAVTSGLLRIKESKRWHLMKDIALPSANSVIDTSTNTNTSHGDLAVNEFKCRKIATHPDSSAIVIGDGSDTISVQGDLQMWNNNGVIKSSGATFDALTLDSGATTNPANIELKTMVAGRGQISVTTPDIPASNNQILKVDSAGLLSSITLNDAGTTANELLSASQIDSRISTATNMSLNSLGGVNLSAPAIDQVLTFDGANWINQTPTGLDLKLKLGSLQTQATTNGESSPYFQPQKRGNFVFALPNGDGVAGTVPIAVYDITSADSPRFVASIPKFNSQSAQRFEFIGKYMALVTHDDSVIAFGDNAKLQLVDISDLGNPVLVQELDLKTEFGVSLSYTGARFIDVAVGNGALYVTIATAENGTTPERVNKTRIYALNDNSATPLVFSNELATGGARAKVFNGTLLMISQQVTLGGSVVTGTVNLIDVSNPFTTSTGSNVSLGAGFINYIDPNVCQLYGTTFISATNGTGGMFRIQKSDLTDITAPVGLGSYLYPHAGSNYGAGVAISGCLAVMVGRADNSTNNKIVFVETHGMTNVGEITIPASSVRNHESAVFARDYLYCGTKDDTDIRKYKLIANSDLLPHITACSAYIDDLQTSGDINTLGNLNASSSNIITNISVGNNIAVQGKIKTNEFEVFSGATITGNSLIQSNNTTNSITLNDTKATYAGSHEFSNGLHTLGELSVGVSTQIKCSLYEGLAGNSTTIRSNSGSAYYQIDASDNLYLIGSTANVYGLATFNNDMKVGTVKPLSTTLSLQAPAGGRKIDISDTKIEVSGTLSVADISTTSHITMPSSTILTTDTITGTAGFGTVNVQSNSTNARLNLNNNGNCTLESKGIEASIVCGTTPNQAELSLNSNADSLLYPHNTYDLKLSNHGDTASILIQDNNDVKVVGNFHLSGTEVKTTDIFFGTTTVNTTPLTIASQTVKGFYYLDAGSVVINLPDTVNDGTVYHFIDTAGTAGTTNRTINGTSGDLINGSASYTLNTDYQSVSIIRRGLGWVVF